jgi:hypothetical protein
VRVEGRATHLALAISDKRTGWMRRGSAVRLFLLKSIYFLNRSCQDEMGGYGRITLQGWQIKLLNWRVKTYGSLTRRSVEQAMAHLQTDYRANLKYTNLRWTLPPTRRLVYFRTFLGLCALTRIPAQSCPAK